MTATRAAAKYNMPLKDVQARRKKETSKQESNKLLKKKKSCSPLGLFVCCETWIIPSQPNSKAATENNF